jgi:alpha-glucosidase
MNNIGIIGRDKFHFNSPLRTAQKTKSIMNHYWKQRTHVAGDDFTTQAKPDNTGVRKRMKQVFCFGLWCSFSLVARGDEVQMNNLKDGIAFSLGGNQVELRVATPHAFRLHVAPVARTPGTPSIYLSGVAQPATPFTVTHDGSIIGIKTEFGELQVDSNTQKWSLRNSNGTALTDWASLQPGQFETGASTATPHPLFYGSGNVPKRGALTQTEALSKTGHGSTSLPQYWSNSGYGTLLITQDDNQPAAWKANASGAVNWTITGPSVDLYVAPAANLYDWLRDDAELTGFAPVPARWTFGYMQSRWGWKDKAYIDDTLAQFRKDQLPVDAFIYDFEWYTTQPDYKVKAPGDPNFIDFGWNPALLPDPAKQIADWGQQGLHIVGIRKPRIGNSDNLVLARSKGWILPSNPDDPNGADIKSRDLDYANPAVQTWWQDNNRKFVEAGMAGFWNDEGETTFTEYSYWNLTELALFKQVDPNSRFWSLNRSFGPGVQRFGAAAWTGDIQSKWETLEKTTGELLSYSLSGMPYATCDIGGFKGNPTPELLARWMQAGVFFPIQRSHSEIRSTPHFPWLFGPDVEASIKIALDLRYQLIPYYYSLASENYQTAAPLMRPLVMEFPDDDKVAGMTDEWLMGKGLLAAPVLAEGGARDVYLPKDQWFTFGTNQMTQGPQTVHVTSKLDEIPLYVRAGTILPLGPVLQYTGEATTEPLQVQVYPGKDGTFAFVEDDGKTLDYQKGVVRTTAFSWNDQTKTLSWKISGSYDGSNRFHQIKAVLFAPSGATSKDASLDQDGSITFP